MIKECPNCGTQIKATDDTCIICPTCGFQDCNEWIIIKEGQ